MLLIALKMLNYTSEQEQLQMENVVHLNSVMLAFQIFL